MIVQYENVKEKTWNDALIETEPQGTIFQSTYWADYLRNTYADHPIYLASLDRKGNIQGLLLAIESCYAKHSALTSSGKRNVLFSKLYRHALTPLFHKVLPSITWENGPVFPSQFMKQNPRQKDYLYKRIVEEVVDEARRRNCYAIKFARPAFFSDNSEVFSSLGFQARRMGTILYDLSQPLDILWEHIDRDARRTIRRGVEQGVEVAQVSNPSGLKEFHDLSIQLSRRAGQRIYTFSRLVSLWNHFVPLDKIAVFIAYVKEKPVAGGVFLMHNEIIHFYIVGDSDDARSSKTYGNEVLLWHVIKWAREMGLRYFDHSGVQLHRIDSGSKKARGIAMFKLKWGGQIVEYHDYEKHLKEKRLVKWLNHFLADSVIHN